MQPSMHPTLVALTAAVALFAPGALAQTTPRRLVGFGSSLGFFYDGNNLGATSAGPLLPTLTVHGALSRRVELELWVPLANTRLASVPSWYWADLTARWYPLEDANGLFVQAGLGFMYLDLANEAPLGVLRFPARVGWEFASAGRGVGVQLGARPWLDVVFPGSDLPTGTRLGIAFELSFQGYITRNPS